MTQTELDRKIYAIERENVSREEKDRRINLLRSTFNRQQQRRGDEAATRQEKEETALKASLKHSYLQNPAATEADFERDYSQLRSQYLSQQALKPASAARAAQSRITRSTF